MKCTPDDLTYKSESPEPGHVKVEPHPVPPASPSHRSPSLSSNSTRTATSTPATSQTQPVAISRPPPPRRHTEKPALQRLPSVQFPPPFTHKTTTVIPQAGPCTTNNDPYTERSYLFQSLQGQNERAKRLLQRLSTAEERLLLGCLAAGEARRIRKEMRLLKKKMADNAQQERLTLLRLGDLYVEIQARERWVQVQQQRLSALMAQQQHPYCPRVFAAMTTSHGREDLMAAPTSPADAVPALLLGQMSPPPPPPTAVSCFSSFPPLSPCTLSPLSPSFVPGLPFEANGFWAAELKSGLGKYGDGNASPEQGEEGLNERGRGRTPMAPAPSRTSSVPRMSGSEKERKRGASVPAARLVWADEAAAEEVSVDE